MPKHLTKIDRVASLPAIANQLDGYPVYLETDGVIYLASPNAATPGWSAVRMERLLRTIRPVAAAYTVLDSDERPVVLADATGGAFTVTLPVASAGLEVTVKKVDSSANAVSVSTPAATTPATIDGAGSTSLAAQYEVTRLVSDGTNWFVI